MLWIAVALADPPEDEEGVRDAMASHWRIGVELRDAVVRGRLGEARRLAATLDVDVGADAPAVVAEAASWIRPFVRGLEHAPDLRTAASQVALMGAACGSCHRQQGVEQSFVPPEPPSTGSIMEKHITGASWMWAGLVASDDALFQRGAATFSFPMQSGGNPDHLEALSRRARTAAGPLRTSAYGALLASCAGCHTAVVTQRPPDVLVAHMHERLTLVGQAREAVRDGRRREWSGAGRALATLDTPPDLQHGPWAPWMDQLEQLAFRLSTTRDREEAAELLGRVALHCGACHTAIGEGPRVPREDELDGSVSGEDLLWLGLLSGNDATWALGAREAGMPGVADVVPYQRPGVYAQFLAR